MGGGERAVPGLTSTPLGLLHSYRDRDKAIGTTVDSNSGFCTVGVLSSQTVSSAYPTRLSSKGSPPIVTPRGKRATHSFKLAEEPGASQHRCNTRLGVGAELDSEERNKGILRGA